MTYEHVLRILPQTPKGADTDEHKYKHKNLDAILPDPGNIIGLEDSQLGKMHDELIDPSVFF